MDRRRFLGLMGASAAEMMFVAACGQSQPPPVPTREGVQPRPVERLDPAKTFLHEVVNNAPDSPVKTAVRELILPYFQEKPVSTVDRGGVSYKVINPTVKRAHTYTVPARGAQVIGGASPRGDVRGLESVTPIETKSILLPLLGIYTEEDKRQIPKDKIASDGTPIFEIAYDPSGNFSEGLNPYIEIVSTHPSVIKDAEGKRTATLLEAFGVWKEACTLLLDDVWLAEITARMIKDGFPTHVMARDGRNVVSPREAVINSLGNLSRLDGKFIALFDIAANVVAMKAMEGTETLERIGRHDITFGRVIPHLATLDLGDTPQSILYQSLAWTNASKEAAGLDHVGNMLKIP